MENNSIVKKAMYCSGRAISLLNFFRKNDIKNYPFDFFIYDGEDTEVLAQLKNLDKNIPVYHFQKGGISLSDYILDLCNKYHIDFLFCVGMGILKGKLIEEYKNRIINIHPSLLPSFKGLNAIDQALATNVQVLGMTAHFIDKGIDTGDIIMQAILPRYQYKDYNSVLDFLSPILKKLFYFLDNKLLITNKETGIVEFKMYPEELLITQQNLEND